MSPDYKRTAAMLDRAAEHAPADYDCYFAEAVELCELMAAGKLKSTEPDSNGACSYVLIAEELDNLSRVERARTWTSDWHQAEAWLQWPRHTVIALHRDGEIVVHRYVAPR